MHSIQRKAVGRKPVGGPAERPASVVGASGATSPAPIIPYAVHSQEARQGHLAQPAQPTGYFDVAYRNTVPAALSSTQPASSVKQNSTTSGYNSIAAVVVPTSPSSAAYHSPANPTSPQLERLHSVGSHNSARSIASGSWPASPGSVASYQTNITTPLSQTTSYANPIQPANPTAPISRTLSQSSTASAAQFSPTCSQCRATILANVSIFDCLICSTGGVSTIFCVYCYTTGAAAKGHSRHDPSFFTTSSDPIVEPERVTKVGSVQIPSVPAHVWVTRKSATGKLWYQHRATGFKTHLRPLLATVPPPVLPTGWEARVNPDGRKYYFNVKSGASSWTIPSPQPLPSGWKEVRTPDCVPFYIHETMQLTCWERPGDSPSTYTHASKSSKDISPASKSKKSGGSSTAVHGVAAAGAAVTLAAQLADAADLSPQGIISATVAAAKLTHHGAKIAGKKMGKLAKSKNVRRASKLFTSASALASIADGGEFDGGDDFEETATEYEYCGTVETEANSVVQETAYQQEYAESYSQPIESYAAPPSGYEQPDPAPVYESTAFTAGPPITYAPGEYPPTEEPAMAVNNIYVQETAVYNDTVVYQTYTEQSNIVVVDNTQTIVDQQAQCVDVVQPIYLPPPDSMVVPTIPLTELPQPTVIQESYPPPFYAYEPAVPVEPEAQLLLACDPTIAPMPMPTSPLPSDTVPPLVFDPVLAGPMMVNPPDEQNGVVFAPTYV